MLTLRWNYLLHGRDTFGYHLVNVVLHSIVSLLIYFLALILFGGGHHYSFSSRDGVDQDKQNKEGEGGKRLLALMAALFFATHPIHTDAIDSIVGRAEALYGLFFLLSFLTYVKSAPSPTSPTQWRWFAASIACFVLSVLSKEMGVMILGRILADDFFLASNFSFSTHSRPSHPPLSPLTLFFSSLYTQHRIEPWMGSAL